MRAAVAHRPTWAMSSRRPCGRKVQSTSEGDSMPTITPFLWFDTEAHDAAELYTSIFPNSRITDVTRYGDAGPGEPGSVMTVKFELDGQAFVALNGGKQPFHFDES